MSSSLSNNNRLHKHVSRLSAMLQKRMQRLFNTNCLSFFSFNNGLPNGAPLLPSSSIRLRNKSLPLVIYMIPFVVVTILFVTLLLHPQTSTWSSSQFPRILRLPHEMGNSTAMYNIINGNNIRNNMSEGGGNGDINGGGVGKNGDDHREDGERVLFYDVAKVEAARGKWGRRFVDGALAGELWNHVKHDVVIGVKTGHEVASRRLDKLRTSGWWSIGRDVPNMLVIGDRDHDDLGVIGVRDYGLHLLRSAFSRDASPSPVNSTAMASEAKHNNHTFSGLPAHWFERSGWRGDKDKNLPALHLLSSVFPGKKWYLLLDDDTYIFLDNFARYILQAGMDDKPVYTGKVFYISNCGDFAHDATLMLKKSEPKLFAHGGSGIVLNGHAMRAMYTSVPQCIRDFSSCWAGDMQVGLCLRRRNIYVRLNGRHKILERHFIPFSPSKALSDRRYSTRWKGFEEPLTFHKIADAEQHLVSQFEKISLRQRRSVSYTPLRKFILGHGVLPAHTTHDKHTRYYSSEFMPPGVK